MQPEKNNESELVDIYEALGCGAKNDDVPDKVTLANNFILEELLEILLDIKMPSIKAEPNLEAP